MQRVSRPNDKAGAESIVTAAVVAALEPVMQQTGAGQQQKRQRPSSCDVDDVIVEQWQQRTRVRLAEPLNPRHVAVRRGPGGQSIYYMPSDAAISAANDTFTPLGWNCELKELRVDMCERKGAQWLVATTAHMRVTLMDGTFHEDIGCGDASLSSRPQAMAKAVKQAVTDARKRCLRLFGGRLGNSLRDKAVLNSIREQQQREQHERNAKQRQQAALAQAALAAGQTSMGVVVAAAGGPTMHAAPSWNGATSSSAAASSSSSSSSAVSVTVSTVQHNARHGFTSTTQRFDAAALMGGSTTTTAATNAPPNTVSAVMAAPSAQAGAVEQIPSEDDDEALAALADAMAEEDADASSAVDSSGHALPTQGQAKHVSSSSSSSSRGKADVSDDEYLLLLGQHAGPIGAQQERQPQQQEDDADNNGSPDVIPSSDVAADET